MDATTTLGWLIGLSAWLLLLTVTVALDLKRHWNQTASDLARRLAVNAVQEAELEAMATGSQVMVRAPEPDAEVVRAIRQAREPWGETVQAERFESTPPPLNELLIPPPMVGGDTLRDWLIHYRNSPEAWMEVTEEFYARAAQDPDVADYFVGVDWEHLKRHFMGALVLITHTGVTRALPARMAALHSDVRNSHGDPITPAVFDTTIGVLVDVLKDCDVPADTLAQLGRTVGPFRIAIAREPARTADTVVPDRLPPTEVRPNDAPGRVAWPTWRDQRGPGVTEEDV